MGGNGNHRAVLANNPIFDVGKDVKGSVPTNKQYITNSNLHGPVAQLGRAPDLHSGGRGFEFHPGRQEVVGNKTLNPQSFKV